MPAKQYDLIVIGTLVPLCLFIHTALRGRMGLDSPVGAPPESTRSLGIPRPFPRERRLLGGLRRCFTLGPDPLL